VRNVFLVDHLKIKQISKHQCALRETESA
jgi:hypothetical protein